MKLRDLLRGTPAHPPMPEWRPLEEDEPAAVPGQCTATTRNGHPCKLPARPGSDRCVLPAHQRI